MSNRLGFSLVEVLVALAIFSLSSMTLVKYQFQIIKNYQTQQQNLIAQQYLNDLSEVVLGQFLMPPLLKQQIKQSLHGSYSLDNTDEASIISIKYKPSNRQKIKTLKRVL